MQKLSPEARRRKKARDKAVAMSPRRRAMKAENQRKHVGPQKKPAKILKVWIMTILPCPLYLQKETALVLEKELN
jgi:hypothetical protein